MTQCKPKRLRSVRLSLFLAVLAVAAGTAHAKSVKQQNLHELITHADSIVMGTVSHTSDGFQGNLPFTEVTLDVARSLKGHHGERFTFRQFGLTQPRATGDGRVNLMVTPAGWPTFAKGEQVLLFLHTPASITGFQTTAGLSQGKFTLRGDSLANDTQNQALFEGVRITATLPPQLQKLVDQPGGSMAAQDFLSLVSLAVEENWIENGVMTHED